MKLWTKLVLFFKKIILSKLKCKKITRCDCTICLWNENEKCTNLEVVIDGDGYCESNTW